MQIKLYNGDIAYVKSDTFLITNTNSALDLMATVNYETSANKLILEKASILPEFFDLSTRIAGEILQKYINYNVRLAIVGDFSSITSKSLRDFIYESNNGRNFYFVSTIEEAVEKLSC